MATVSYVVTLYNKKVFLPFLTAGLAAQEGDFDKQYIFVDDGSTDGTSETLRDLTASWENVVIISQENQGPAVAFNRGLAAVSGDYVKPMDGDDVLLPWATSWLLQALAATDCEVAYVDRRFNIPYTLQKSAEEQIRAITPMPLVSVYEPDFLHRALSSSRTNPSAWLATRSAVERSGGCDEGVFIQDYSIELRLGATSKIARVDTPIFMMPQEVCGRLSLDMAQAMHDGNLTVVRFLRQHAKMVNECDMRHGIHKIAARAWNWGKRKGGHGLLSPLFLTLIATRLRRYEPTLEFEAFVCAPFFETSSIRRPPQKPLE